MTTTSERSQAPSAQDKRAGRDWAQLILKTHGPNRAACVVQDLEGDPAYPTREDKPRRFREVMGPAKGACRSSYFRLRKRLEQADRLIPATVAPIPLRWTKPPGVPSLLELESMGDLPPARPEEEPVPVDVPAREQFAQPVQGQTPQTPPRIVTDDLLAWERPQGPDEDEER